MFKKKYYLNIKYLYLYIIEIIHKSIYSVHMEIFLKYIQAIYIK